MKQFEQENVNDILSEVNATFNKTILDANTCTTKLYNTLVDCTDAVQGVKKKVGILGDMITDLQVLTGNTKTNVYLEELDVVSKDNIKFENGRISLGVIEESFVDYAIDGSSIISDKPYGLYDTAGNSKSLADFFRYNSPTSLTVNSMGYDFKFALAYPRVSKINQIVITLPKDTNSYPIVENITFLDKDGFTEIPIKILNNGLRTYSLDENRTIGNKYVIDIEPVNTRELYFSLSSRVDTTLNLLSIKTNYTQFANEGSIVLGPVITDKPILKAGLSSASMTDNVELFVSTDANEWIPITDSFRVSLKDTRKIVSFNTINDASFKSEEDIRKLFFRIDLISKDLDTVVSNLQTYDSYREDGVMSSTRPVEKNRISIYRQKPDEFSYGKESFASGANLSNKTKTLMEKITINGLPKVRGFEDTDLSVGETDNVYMNVNVKLNPKRIPATSLIDAREFDAVGSTLYDMNVIPFTEEINTLSRRDLCLRLIAKEDEYKIIALESKEFITKDFSKGFAQNNSELLVQVPKEDIVIRNSIGQEVATFLKDDHLTIEKNGVKIYFISLAGVLFEIPDVSGYNYNFMYPIKALDENEFSLEDGKIILGRGSIVTVDGYKILKNKVTTQLEINYQNGNIWERVDPLYTYFHEQLDLNTREQSVIKLDHRSIEKGSLKIYEYNEYENSKLNTDIYISVANTQT